MLNKKITKEQNLYIKIKVVFYISFDRVKIRQLTKNTANAQLKKKSTKTWTVYNIL